MSKTESTCQQSPQGTTERKYLMGYFKPLSTSALSSILNALVRCEACLQVARNRFK